LYYYDQFFNAPTGNLSSFLQVCSFFDCNTAPQKTDLLLERYFIQGDINEVSRLQTPKHPRHVIVLFVQAHGIQQAHQVEPPPSHVPASMRSGLLLFRNASN